MSDEIIEVTQVVHSFAECWNRHDMNVFAEIFAPGAELVNGGGPQTLLLSDLGGFSRGTFLLRMRHSLNHH